MCGKSLDVIVYLYTFAAEKCYYLLKTIKTKQL